VRGAIACGCRPGHQAPPRHGCPAEPHQAPHRRIRPRTLLSLYDLPIDLDIDNISIYSCIYTQYIKYIKMYIKYISRGDVSVRPITVDGRVGPPDSGRGPTTPTPHPALAALPGCGRAWPSHWARAACLAQGSVPRTHRHACPASTQHTHAHMSQHTRGSWPEPPLAHSLSLYSLYQKVSRGAPALLVRQHTAAARTLSRIYIKL
jgi:hypothetical protein